MAVIGVVLLALATIFWGWPAFQDFRQRRIVRIANSFFATQDFRSAYLLLDQHVRSFPGNLEARRLLAKVQEEYGPGMGLSEWEHLAKIEPNNPDNQVGLITAALRVGQLEGIPASLSALQKLRPDSVDYHRLSAALALARHDQPTLRRAIENLARLEPDNETTQFSLATLRLRSSLPAERAEARATLDRLAKGDRLRIRAGLALIQDAPARWPEEKETAKLFQNLVRALELDESPLSRPSSQLLLSVFRVREPGLGLLVSHLLQQPEPSSEDAVSMAQWMLQHRQSREALVWLETLPEKTRGSPGVLASRAACSIAIESWEKLEELLLADAWGPVPADAVKYAMQARLLRSEKNESRAEAVWNNAVQASGDSLPGLRMLHRLAVVWRWPGKDTQVLWSLVRKFPADRQAWTTLVASALTERDTPGVWRVYNAWMQAAPDEVSVQIERLVIGLLTQPGEKDLAAQAAGLFAKYPDYPGARLAQATALWRDGRAGEALTVLDLGAIRPEQEPRQALVRGLVLADLNRRSESERMFSLFDSRRLLPEEAALIAAARR